MVCSFCTFATFKCGCVVMYSSPTRTYATKRKGSAVVFLRVIFGLFSSTFFSWRVFLPKVQVYVRNENWNLLDIVRTALKKVPSYGYNICTTCTYVLYTAFIISYVRMYPSRVGGSPIIEFKSTKSNIIYHRCCAHLSYTTVKMYQYNYHLLWSKRCHLKIILDVLHYAVYRTTILFPFQNAPPLKFKITCFGCRNSKSEEKALC